MSIHWLKMVKAQWCVFGIAEQWPPLHPLMIRMMLRLASYQRRKDEKAKKRSG